MSFYYVTGVLLTESGIYADDQYHLVAVLITTNNDDEVVTFWTKGGPSGGQYRGKIVVRDRGTSLYSIAIPIYAKGGGYAEFGEGVDEVIVYAHTIPSPG